MKRISFFAASLVAASVAIGGCSQDIGSSDEQTGTSDDELLTLPKKLRFPPNMFWTFPIKTEAEDRALAARIVAAGRMNIDPLRSTAVDGMVPVPDTTKRCRMTAPMHGLLSHFDRVHATMQGFMTYSKAGGFHADSLAMSDPPGASCLNYAIDITRFQDLEIVITKPDEAERGILDVLASLPPGKYELGLPRSPYPNDHPDRKAVDDQYRDYGTSKALSVLFDPATRMLKAGIDIEHYHHWFGYEFNTKPPCMVYNAKLTTPPAAGSFCNRNDINDDLSFLAPYYRDEIIEAITLARRRGAVIAGVYGDALNHMHVTVKDESPAPALATNDIDGDGRADVLWHNEATGENGIWLMGSNADVRDFTMIDRPRRITSYTNAGTGWKMIGAADFDRDTRNDVVFFNEDTGAKSILYMDGLHARAHKEYPTVGQFDANWLMVAAGDFNGDGNAELLWQHIGTSEVGIWSVDGRSVSAKINDRMDASWKVGGAADFDHNGTTDIVWRHAPTGEVRVWLMDTQGLPANVLPLPSMAATDPQVRTVADYDNNGTPDLWLHQYGGSGVNMIRFQNGPSVVSQRVVPVPVPDTNWSIASAP
jgi:hypothetical protein